MSIFTHTRMCFQQEFYEVAYLSLISVFLDMRGHTCACMRAWWRVCFPCNHKKSVSYFTNQAMYFYSIFPSSRVCFHIYIASSYCVHICIHSTCIYTRSSKPEVINPCKILIMEYFIQVDGIYILILARQTYTLKWLSYQQ